MLRLGRPSRAALAALAGAADRRPLPAPPPLASLPPPVLATAYGQLYQGDCLAIMAALASDSLDLIFADPPQNLGKWYPSGIDDRLAVGHYLAWCERWLQECIRVLKPGGALFVWNLPRWNAELAGFLAGRLTLRIGSPWNSSAGCRGRGVSTPPTTPCSTWSRARGRGCSIPTGCRWRCAVIARGSWAIMAATPGR